VTAADAAGRFRLRTLLMVAFVALLALTVGAVNGLSFLGARRSVDDIAAQPAP